MRFAVISGATVVNVIEAEPGFELNGFDLVASNEAGPGWSYSYINQLFSPPAPTAPTTADVDVERDRRISAGVMFAGNLYQSGSEDRENISGAATAALAAMIGGATPGDLRWHGGDSDFVWIAMDNALVPMDAQTVFAFGLATMAHKQNMIFAARALKDADPITSDYADNGYWPAST